MRKKKIAIPLPASILLLLVVMASFPQVLAREKRVSKEYPTYMEYQGNPGREYVVCIPAGGSVSLYDASLKGQISLEWCDVLKAKWTEPESILPKGIIELNCPGDGHWMAVLKTE